MKLSGDPGNKRMAERILRITADHHLLLVSLLIGNAIVLEYLPLVIHLLMPDWAAILFSTFAVVTVAEIIPMSLSTGRHKIAIAYYGAPLVRGVIIVFYLVAWPIARLLDWLLGHQSS